MYVIKHSHFAHLIGHPKPTGTVAKNSTHIVVADQTAIGIYLGQFKLPTRKHKTLQTLGAGSYPKIALAVAEHGVQTIAELGYLLLIGKETPQNHSFGIPHKQSATEGMQPHRPVAILVHHKGRVARPVVTYAANGKRIDPGIPGIKTKHQRSRSLNPNIPGGRLKEKRPLLPGFIGRSTKDLYLCFALAIQIQAGTLRNQQYTVGSNFINPGNGLLSG